MAGLQKGNKGGMDKFLWSALKEGDADAVGC